jgi:copper homeostasis protein
VAVVYHRSSRVSEHFDQRSSRARGPSSSSRVLLEVIVQTVADAREAALGGADRLEVVRDIGEGGLTPSLALVRAIAAETSLPLRVMVRENGGYSTDARELPRLQRAAADFAAAAVDGLVIGFARDGRLSLDDVVRVLEPAPEIPVTFHRAFDRLRDPLGAIDEICTLARIDRILTDGGGGSGAGRCRRLREYRARAQGRVEILAGGGVDEEAFTLLAAEACVREIHVGVAARDGDDPVGPVSAHRVRRLRALAG